MKTLLNLKKELDLKDIRLIESRDIKIAPWVSLKCQYGCGEFGKRYSCPPFSPPPLYSNEIFSEYNKGLLIHDPASWKIRWAVAEIEKKAVALGYFKAFGMGSGPCGLCEKCPDDHPCVKTEEARPSMEAMGIDVFATVKKFGYDLIHNPETAQFFGLVLLE